ncbi:MAG: hypothetical protein JO266_08305 [Acidobacteria bacterium]|nr:hypothetical protein [Acidobacteriota bacterium]
MKDDLGRKETREPLGIYNKASRDADQSQIEQNLAALAAVRREAPSFSAWPDYDWAFDAASYSHAIVGGVRYEPQSLRFQVVVLHALTEAWAKLPTDVLRGLDPAGICARYTFSSEWSPSCKNVEGYRYIIIPMGFQRRVRELLGLLRLAVSGSPEDAAAALRQVADAATAASFIHLPRVLLPRHLAARANARCEMADEYGIEAHLKEIVPAFTGVANVIAQPPVGTFEAALEYLVMAYAVYHEVGHLLYGDRGRGGDWAEQQADRTAFSLFAGAWGWMAGGADRLGLPEGAWILLGPIVFMWVLECLQRLEIMAAPPRSQPVLTWGWFSLLQRRARIVEQVRALTTEIYPRFGVVVPPAATMLMLRLIGVLDLAAAALGPSAETALLAAEAATVAGLEF